MKAETRRLMSRVKPVLVVSSGNFLEMYDFMVFGYYAKAIGAAFFPTVNPTASLLLALMTFGAGFLMRPVGAFVLGAYIDRHGRRKGLLLTLALMGLGTLSIALTPTYHRIGLLAPIVVLVGRLVQGLSAGVEVGGASVYLAEIASEGRKGFFVAWQSASQQLAVIFASLLGLTLNALITSSSMADWGWRVPFWIGSLLLPFLLLIRGSLKETQDLTSSDHRVQFSFAFKIVVRNWRIVALGTSMVMMTTVFFYTITAYTPTYGAAVLGLTPIDSMIVTLVVGTLNFIMLPTMGALSDQYGRLRPMLISALLGATTGYLALLWMVAQPSFARLLIVEIWLALVYSTYNGAMVVYLTEIMPKDVKTTGFSLAYSLATAVFGGFTPALVTYLIFVTGNRAAPGVWLSFAAICSFAGIVLTSRFMTKLASLRMPRDA